MVICVVHGKYRSKGNPSNFTAFLIWKRTTLIVWSALLKSREEQNGRYELNHRILELRELGTVHPVHCFSKCDPKTFCLSVNRAPYYKDRFQSSNSDLPRNLRYTFTHTHTHPTGDIVKVRTAYLVQRHFFKCVNWGPKRFKFTWHYLVCYEHLSNVDFLSFQISGSCFKSHETCHCGFCCGCPFSHEIQAIELFLNSNKEKLRIRFFKIVKPINWEVQDVHMGPILNKIDKRFYDLLLSLFIWKTDPFR